MRHDRTFEPLDLSKREVKQSILSVESPPHFRIENITFTFKVCLSR